MNSCFGIGSVFIVSINVRTLKIIELRRQKTLVIIIAFSLTEFDFHARTKKKGAYYLIYRIFIHILKKIMFTERKSG